MIFIIYLKKVKLNVNLLLSYTLIAERKSKIVCSPLKLKFQKSYFEIELTKPTYFFNRNQSQLILALFLSKKYFSTINYPSFNA